MLKTFKYRLYPTKRQTRALAEQLEAHRFLYNEALAERKNVYATTGRGVSYFKQATVLLPKLRKENSHLELCNYSSLQQTLRRLDKSFKAFFQRVKSGFPRFKSIHRFNTIAYAAIGDGCQIKNSRLYLQNVGCIKVKWHRPITGKIKTLSITRRNDRWYVSFVVEYDVAPLPKTGKVIGIDVGLKSFVTTSDGLQIEPPKYLIKSEKKLAKAQRILSRRKKGSNRRKKARKSVARLHEKVANQRLDFSHKVACFLVKNYDGFAVERLNIKGMVKNRHLSKHIHDASWGLFLLILTYKAESAGRWVKKVTPNGTSQVCCSCGQIVRKSLSVRIHTCPYCGVSLDRDLNAAINILARTEPSWREPQVPVEARS